VKIPVSSPEGTFTAPITSASEAHGVTDGQKRRHAWIETQKQILRQGGVYTKTDMYRDKDTNMDRHINRL